MAPKCRSWSCDRLRPDAPSQAGGQATHGGQSLPLLVGRLLPCLPARAGPKPSQRRAGGLRGGSRPSQGQMAGGGEAVCLVQEQQPTSQLDRLLAGLDELSGTLPDLTSTASWTPARSAPEQRVGGRAVLPCSAGADSAAGGAASVSAGGGLQQGTSGGGVVQGGAGGGPGVVPAAGGSKQVVMGRPGGPGLPARSYEEDVDYALEKDGEKRRGGEEGAPYHTRYDSKPFSYIR